ncbi:MAG: beta-lactamase family protein [Clostridiales bacterium]|nr:beta-lactamase family protein [Clostridiales bacterium]
MPVGNLKNTLYGLALPVLGRKSGCRRVAGEHESQAAVKKALVKHHVVGASIQCFEKGRLTTQLTAGYASLEGKRPVEADTVFRTASIAKMVSALLVFRLQSMGALDVREPVSDFLGYRVSNPHCPDAPLTLGMLLNHTSSIVDSPAYFSSFTDAVDLRTLLEDPRSYSRSVPGMHFRYSNLAAGMVGCMLESRFGMSLETLMQKELFSPLGIQATFDITKLPLEKIADSYRVLPREKGFSAAQRMEKAAPLAEPDPRRHYLLASGNLFLTAEMLARLALVICGSHPGFIDDQCLSLMRTPTADWPEQDVRMRHSMGLLQLEDPSVYARPLWGHQGFAYGAVNGVFFDAEGNGFAALNSGAAERRRGHLACVNEALIGALMPKME